MNTTDTTDTTFTSKFIATTHRVVGLDALVPVVFVVFVVSKPLKLQL